jgi:type I restriction enzyme S subunit
MGDLKSIPINIPSLPEQQKIAAFLTEVDAKLSQLTKKKVLLENYKKGVMQQIFSQEIRFKHNNSTKFGTREVSEFPDWEVKKLGDVGTTLNGLTGKTKEDFGAGKPYIQYKQVFNSSKINIEKCGLVDISDSDKQTKVKYGDVFFTTSSETPKEIGTASVLLDNIEEMYLNSFCFGFRVEQTLLYPPFSQYLFRNNDFRKKMIPLAQGSTRYNISKSAFLKLKVKLPKVEEQNKIANFLSDLDAKIEVLSTSIENTETFKKGLLQQMFV